MRLINVSQASYYGVLLEFPFKGDEAALRSMEHAELITVGTRDGVLVLLTLFCDNIVHDTTGRPSTIRPGRPVFRWVFERLANGDLASLLDEYNLY